MARGSEGEIEAKSFAKIGIWVRHPKREICNASIMMGITCPHSAKFLLKWGGGRLVDCTSNGIYHGSDRKNHGIEPFMRI